MQAAHFDTRASPFPRRADLPAVLATSPVDIVFNIAEGFRGRNREAQVPALLELLDIPYTGSDPATLSLALTTLFLAAWGVFAHNSSLFGHVIEGPMVHDRVLALTFDDTSST